MLRLGRGGPGFHSSSTLSGGTQPEAAVEPGVCCAQGGALHLALALAPVWAQCPRMVWMSFTHDVYFWLFPFHVESAIKPDTFCFFKFSLVFDSNVEMGSKRIAHICTDTEAPIVSLR